MLTPDKLHGYQQKPTPAQEREHHRLRQQGVEVWVIDSVDAGKLMVDGKVRGL